MKARCVLSVALAVVVGTLVACQKAPREPEAAVLTTLEALNNASYVIPEVDEGTAFKLTDGAFERKADQGYLLINLEAHAVGNLDSDGTEDAAVVLSFNMGGSGTYYMLTLMLADQGQLRQVGGQSLGDRIVLKNLAIENRQVRLDMLTQGPNDPMVKPTQQETRLYKLRGNQLAEVTPQQE